MLLHCRALLSFPGGWNRLKYMQHHILLRLQESVVSPVWCSFHLQLRWSYLYYTNICSKMQEKIEQMFAKNHIILLQNGMYSQLYGLIIKRSTRSIVVFRMERSVCTSPVSREWLAFLVRKRGTSFCAASAWTESVSAHGSAVP